MTPSKYSLSVSRSTGYLPVSFPAPHLQFGEGLGDEASENNELRVTNHELSSPHPQ